MGEALISLRGVGFGYGNGDVLRDVTAEVRRGDFIVVRGPSGGGKSTLLRLLAKLEVPRAGSILCDGTPYADIPSTALRRRIAYLQQLPVILPGSVYDNLLLPSRFGPGAGASKRAERYEPLFFCTYRNDALRADGDRNALREQLRRARLDGVELDTPAGELSVGQKQRLAFIRLLLMRPEALLLDEPVASLDAESASILHAWMAELHAQSGATLLLVSHAPMDGLPAGARSWRVAGGHVTEETS